MTFIEATALGLGAITALAGIAQTFFLLPYRVAQLENQQKEASSDREALAAIRTDLALLRRDFQWLAQQVAKHEGIEFPLPPNTNG